MKKLLVIVIAFAVVIGIAYWLWATFKNAETPSRSLEKVTVRLNWPHNAQFAGMYAAKEKGLYEKVGLDVGFQEFNFDYNWPNYFNDERIQFHVSSGFGLLSGIDNGTAMTAVMAIHQISPYAFIALKERDIETPADLKGKTVGSVNPQNATLDALLDLFGVKKDEVAVRRVAAEEREQELIQKKVDAVDLYRTHELYAYNQKGVSHSLLLPERFGFEIYGDVLLTSRKFAKENPELVKRFAQATIEGWTYASEHKDEALDIVAKYESSQYKDREYERYILEETLKLIKPTGGKVIGRMEFIPWNRVYQAMRQSGLLKNEFDITEAYTNEFLE